MKAVYAVLSITPKNILSRKLWKNLFCPRLSGFPSMVAKYRFSKHVEKIIGCLKPILSTGGLNHVFMWKKVQRKWLISSIIRTIWESEPVEFEIKTAPSCEILGFENNYQKSLITGLYLPSNTENMRSDEAVPRI